MHSNLQLKNYNHGKMTSLKLLKNIRSYNALYLLLILAAAYVFVFNMVPIFNQLYYSVVRFELFGNNRYVGLDIFKEVLSSGDFARAFKNTVIIGLYMIVFYFPVPLILALLLNEMLAKSFKRIFQTIIVIPYFISWVVVTGLFVMILNPDGGMVNELIKLLGGQPIGFFTDEQWFRRLLVLTAIWKSSGYGTVIYLASISSINPDLYEAALVDGAKRMQQVWHITLPSIKETILIVFLLQISNAFMIFDQVLIMYNPLVYSTGDVLGTYSYRQGLVNFNFSQSTVVNMVGSVISFSIFEISNFFSQKATGRNLL
ncbi:MAG: sugar ABC transporter permease [Ruminiclostridium sp.]|nr:sugar ABC transporter permease [Ruminiclostridium sp.]